MVISSTHYNNSASSRKIHLENIISSEAKVLIQILMITGSITYINDFCEDRSKKINNRKGFMDNIIIVKTTSKILISGTL